MTHRVLILNGSPRKGKSTSEAFADAFAKQYNHLNGQVSILDCSTPPDNPKKREALSIAIEQADTLGLFFPLYVDSLPSNLLFTLYEIEALLHNSGQVMKVFAVTQCGYPFTANMQHAINNCKFFAESIQGQWLGGLSYGGGVLINGRSLDKLGKKGKKLNQVFAGMAGAIYNNIPIPDEVFKPVYQTLNAYLISPLIPLINFFFWLNAKKKGIDISARPYEGMTFLWD
jgi:hypothetical protein